MPRIFRPTCAMELALKYGDGVNVAFIPVCEQCWPGHACPEYTKFLEERDHERRKEGSPSDYKEPDA